MLAYYINLILFIISLLTLIYFTYKPVKNYRLIFKIITSILFISTGIISYLHSQGDFYYFILLIIGLIFSLFGDILLVPKINTRTGELTKMFLYGLISFSITHIMYVLAFIHVCSFNWTDLIIVFIISSLIIYTLKHNKNINFKNMFIPTYVYSYLICLMVFESFKVTLLSLNEYSSSLLLLGSLLFVFSDIILAFILFYNKPSKVLSGLNLLTYYIGQLLIASTLLFL
ncbi:hypothetical protein HF520_08295 [Romboutsia sp. CE17]|uniref:lysoplasmalogenase family protein n=1 Tax=Romboutsia sp. CE17 TaxID=2724150 RepID=UPI001442A8F2|nr:hypothetical protein HF520_08295 [Romboutsia sp. CE17]